MSINDNINPNKKLENDFGIEQYGECRQNC